MTMPSQSRSGFGAAALLVLFFGFAPPLAASPVDAIRAAEAGRFSQAQKLAGHDVSADLVKWMYLLDGGTEASFSQIAAFVTKNPDWPDVDKLYRIAESRLPRDMTHAQIINWFSKNQPVSAQGMERYMDAMLATRRTAPAVSALKAWWVKADLSPAEQREMMDLYRSYFSTADHIRRLEHILTEKQYSAARDLAPRIGQGYAQLVEARVALQEGGKAVEASLSRVPHGLLKDTGLLLSRVQYRRQNDMDREAISLLQKAPPAGQTTEPAAWWKERHVLARRMMEAGDYRTAYKLDKKPTDRQSRSHV